LTRLLVLSHPLRSDSPVWPTNPPAARVELQESIARGDPDNAARLALYSHSGTHVDTPWHFNPDGPAASQLPIDAFVFDAPRLIDVPTGQRQMIRAEALQPHADVVAEADILLIRTGWGERRAADGAVYAGEGPVLHPDTARWLIAHQAAYGVHYLIWQGLIWSSEHPTWTTYHSPIYGCPNPKNITGCHFNHIHLSIF
jgi:kynurenine formamidase